jgi:hypothetical protein
MTDFVPASVRVGNAILRLAIARSTEIDEEATTVFVRGLLDLDPRHVEQVCEEIGREPRREFTPALPELGTIRARVVELAKAEASEQRFKALPPMPADAAEQDRRLWLHCRACGDEPSGWKLVWCAGSGRQRAAEPTARFVDMDREHCGLRKEHAAHANTVRCSCHGNNPVVARRRERLDAARRTT